MSRIDIVIPVYNTADTLEVLLDSLNGQVLAPAVSSRVFLVDDGSSDERFRRRLNSLSSSIALVRHERNRGRAAARNSGAKAGQGDYLLFLDADCYIREPDLVMRHVHAIESGADVSVGTRATEGASFMAALEADVNGRRAAGPPWAALTSANFAIRRAAFAACGGFDERYRCYGFEDRDLAVRLALRSYRIALTPEAVVYHRDAPEIAGLLQRMEEAGEHSSALFMRDHPGFYALLHYSRFDFRIRPYRARLLHSLGVAVWPILRPVAGWVVGSSRAGFALKAPLFRATAGLAYLAGTRRAWRHRGAAGLRSGRSGGAAGQERDSSH